MPNDEPRVLRSATSLAIVLALAGCGSEGGAGSPRDLNGVVVSGLTGPTGIALDDLFVYWTAEGANDGTVAKAPLGGGEVVTLAANQNLPTTIVVDETTVYFAADNIVAEEIKTGGAPIVLASDFPRKTGVAARGDSVYYTFEGGVVKIPMGGGPPLTIAPGPAYGVVTDATSVYWLTKDSVMKAALDGTAKVTLASGQDAPKALTIDAKYAYWASSSDGTVTKVLLGGGTPVAVASAQGDIWSVAVDDTDVYFGTESAVMKVSKNGGSPVQIASAEGALGVAVNDSYVYWTSHFGGNYQSGSISRKLK